MTMLVALCVVALLEQTAAPGSANAGPTLEAAIAAARAGEHDRALALFERLAKDEPDNYEVKLWVARLQFWTGNTQGAEMMFRALVAEDELNSEALVGLASTQLAQNRIASALELLGKAEQMAPDSSDVLAALGRAYARAGENARAVAYLERAIARTPDDDTRLLLEQVRRSHAHRVELSGFGETFSPGAADARSGDVAINLRINDRWRAFGRGQYQRKFGIDDRRGGGGVEWRPRAHARLLLQALAGPDNEILPRGDTQAELAIGNGRFEWTGTARRLTFAGANVWVLAPGTTVYLGDRVATSLRYYLAITDFASLTRDTHTHSGLVAVSMQAARRLWITLSYVRGIESFETLTTDRIGEFRADTVSGGVRFELPSLTALSVAYDYQRRSDAVTMQRATLAFLQRF